MTKTEKNYAWMMSLFIIFVIISNVYFIGEYNDYKHIQTVMELNIEDEDVLKDTILKLQGE